MEEYHSPAAPKPIKMASSGSPPGATLEDHHAAYLAERGVTDKIVRVPNYKTVP
jgi:hypothetical protein